MGMKPEEFIEEVKNMEDFGIEDWQEDHIKMTYINARQLLLKELSEKFKEEIEYYEDMLIFCSGPETDRMKALGTKEGLIKGLELINNKIVDNGK